MKMRHLMGDGFCVVYTVCCIYCILSTQVVYTSDFKHMLFGSIKSITGLGCQKLKFQSTNHGNFWGYTDNLKENILHRDKLGDVRLGNAWVSTASWFPKKGLVVLVLCLSWVRNRQDTGSTTGDEQNLLYQQLQRKESASFGRPVCKYAQSEVQKAKYWGSMAGPVSACHRVNRLAFHLITKYYICTWLWYIHIKSKI